MRIFLGSVLGKRSKRKVLDEAKSPHQEAQTLAVGRTFRVINCRALYYVDLLASLPCGRSAIDRLTLHIYGLRRALSRFGRAGQDLVFMYSV